MSIRKTCCLNCANYTAGRVYSLSYDGVESVCCKHCGGECIEIEHDERFCELQSLEENVRLSKREYENDLAKYEELKAEIDDNWQSEDTETWIATHERDDGETNESI